MPEGLEQMPDGDFRNLIWFLLNPPEDHRPWTPALRRELIGDEGPAPKSALALPDAPRDLESVALWNPEWRVVCPTYAGAPAKLSEYAGRPNVLMTHPGEVGASRATGNFAWWPRESCCTRNEWIAGATLGSR
jgi:hypothetical protein